MICAVCEHTDEQHVVGSDGMVCVVCREEGRSDAGHTFTPREGA